MTAFLTLQTYDYNNNKKPNTEKYTYGNSCYGTAGAENKIDIHSMIQAKLHIK